MLTVLICAQINVLIHTCTIRFCGVHTFTCILQVYTGTKEQGELSLTHHVVVSLLQGGGLSGYGYHVYMDNFFTSCTLYDDLWNNHSTLACGTVRLGRRGMPQNVISRKPVGLAKDRGAFVSAQQNQLLALAWRDRKVVYLLSTIHTNSVTEVSRRIRENNRFTRKIFPCPQGVSDYTTNMGGVDRADQLCGYYLTDRKGHKWNIKLFFYMMEVCKVNAFILMKQSCNHQPQGQQQLSLLDFTLQLAEGLIGQHANLSKRGRPSLQPLETRLHSRCMPGAFPTRSWCFVCTKRVRQGLQEAKRQTSYGCLDCDKRLCLPKCFTDYHTKAKYWC